MRSWLLMLLAVAVGVATGAQATAAPRQYQIQVVVKQGDRPGSREQGTMEVLARRSLFTLENQAAESFVGSEVRFRDKLVPCGLSIHVQAERGSGRKINLKVVVQQTDAIPRGNGRYHFRTTRVEQDLSFYRGQTIQLRFPRTYQPQTWAEIRVEEFVP